MEDKIYIFGHMNPDTDSVCSAICLSYLKNKQGLNTEPRILSSINDETKYVLNKFKFKVPAELGDVKLQLKDVNYHKGFCISEKESVYDAFKFMQENGMSTVPVVDKNGKFCGSFAMKDIAKNEILGDIINLKTSYDHLLNTLNGKELLRFTEEIDGNVTTVDYRSSTFQMHMLFNNKTVLVVGDRHSIIEYAVNKRVGTIIITGDNEIKTEHLDIAKKNKINIIQTSKTSLEVIYKIMFSNYIENFNFVEQFVCAEEDIYLSDLDDIILNTKHSYYPVIDHSNKCLGLLKLSDLNDKHPKKVILVDHNECTQSVEGLEEAEIVGVVDHHRLGNLGTSKPINFRNMPVGSTCTIIYHLFKENKITIPSDIAALLACGIISDTLLLKSPTTTEIDKDALNNLEKIADIDSEKVAMEMFKANDSTKNKTIKEIVYTDFKTFNHGDKFIAVSCITTLNGKNILKNQDSYIKFLNKQAKENKYDIFVLAITDILKNGSYILYNDDALDILKLAFIVELEQGYFLDGIVSRKKQIIPAITNVIK